MTYKTEFIEFLIRSGALTFGDFVTKSGRNTPYFVNTGRFNTGELISVLGSYYARHLRTSIPAGCDLVFGPAYKGIPLAVTVSASLFREHNLQVGFAFNRKEKKTHGDGGEVVGAKITSESRVVIVEDVITAGTTLQEVVPWLREHFNPKIEGVIIAVDRCERGTGDKSAVQQVESDLGIKVFPIVTAHDIVAALQTSEVLEGYSISKEMPAKILNYLEQYGC